MISVYHCFQRNFPGVRDSIMKFLFVQGWDRLLEAGFQAWLEHSRGFTAARPAGGRPPHHLGYPSLHKAPARFCHHRGWEAAQKQCRGF